MRMILSLSIVLTLASACRGRDGRSCTLEGRILTCPDGSSVEIRDGEPGPQGERGPRGPAGAPAPTPTPDPVVGYWALTNGSWLEIVDTRNGYRIVGQSLWAVNNDGTLARLRPLPATLPPSPLRGDYTTSVNASYNIKDTAGTVITGSIRVVWAFSVDTRSVTVSIYSVSPPVLRVKYILEQDKT